MTMRLTASATALAFLLAQAPLPAAAQNALRYELLSERDLTRIPPDVGGRLNIRIDNTRMANVTDGENVMLFHVAKIMPGSAFAGANIGPGDEIFALNGYEFRDEASFAAYVHALPGGRPTLDYVEHGTGRLIRIAGLQPPSRGYADAPKKPPTGNSDSGSTGLMVIGAIAAGGVLCWITSCLSGSSSAPSISSGGSGGGGGSARRPSYDSAPIAEAPAPPLPSVQGDIHGNLPSDIHGNPW